MLPSKEDVAKGITPYDYKNPPFSLVDKDIPAVRVVEALDRAGFPESEWVTGVAVARRESSFVPDLIGAVNSNTRGYDPENASWDFGLFQISFKWNSHLMAGPKKIGEWDRPDDNARMAKYLFDESVRRGYSGWRPWHTYTSGNYAKYIPLAKEAVAEYKSRKREVAEKPDPVAKASVVVAPTPKEEPVALVIESNATVGIRPTSSGYANTTQGVVVHYPGSPSLTLGSHETCRQQVRNWDSYHRSKGWNGIGYHYLVCHHGIVLTGRGMNKQGAHAPGANSTHVGIQLMVANGSDATPNQLAGFRSFLEYLDERGVNVRNISPHSQWVSTSCPGSILRGRVASNNWGTGGTVTPVPGGGSSGGSAGGSTSIRSAEYQQTAVNSEGYSPRLTVDGVLGPKTLAGVEWLQKKIGVTADGVWGPKTDAAYQKHKKGSVPVDNDDNGKLVVDGVLGENTIKELQRALNEGRF